MRCETRYTIATGLYCLPGIVSASPRTAVRSKAGYALSRLVAKAVQLFRPPSMAHPRHSPGRDARPRAGMSRHCETHDEPATAPPRRIRVGQKGVHGSCAGSQRGTAYIDLDQGHRPGLAKRFRARCDFAVASLPARDGRGPSSRQFGRSNGPSGATVAALSPLRCRRARRSPDAASPALVDACWVVTATRNVLTSSGRGCRRGTYDTALQTGSHSRGIRNMRRSWWFAVSLARAHAARPDAFANPLEQQRRMDFRSIQEGHREDNPPSRGLRRPSSRGPVPSNPVNASSAHTCTPV